MDKKNKKKYTCDDCKWNYICKDNAVGKCKEFTVDRIMSDRFAEKVIKRNRRHYYEYLSKREDV